MIYNVVSFFSVGNIHNELLIRGAVNIIQKYFEIKNDWVVIIL